MKTFDVYIVNGGRLVPYMRVKAKNKDGVRVYLAENRHHGTFYWATSTDWKKVGAGVNL